MSTQFSMRPDSAVSVRQAGMAQLKQQVLRLQQENAALKNAASMASGHGVAEEPDSARAQVRILQEQVASLRNLHHAYGCSELLTITQRLTAEAQRRQQSAEAETMGYRHLDKANKSMEQQLLISQKLLGEATRELCLCDAEIESLKLSAESYRRGQKDAENMVASLEAKLRAKSHEAPKQQVTNVDADFGGAVSTKESSIKSSITIHLDVSQPKKWHMIKRVHAVMAKGTTLDILGPPELVASLVSDMRSTHADHKQQTAAAEHWQKLANDALAEIDTMRANIVTGPTCTMSSHRSLMDELAAKNMQLKMQKQLVETWQEKVSDLKNAIDRARVDMRAEGVRGI